MDQHKTAIAIARKFDKHLNWLTAIIRTGRSLYESPIVSIDERVARIGLRRADFSSFISWAILISIIADQIVVGIGGR